MRLVSACLSLLFCLGVLCVTLPAQQPRKLDNGYYLPNGWKITPLGTAVATEDLLLNQEISPDGVVVVATHGGFNPHGLVVVNVKTREATQRIPLKSAFLGLSWSPKGDRLYVSGGNSTSRSKPSKATIYEFTYSNGKLSNTPVATFEGDETAENTFWAGVRNHPSKPLLYAAHRGTNAMPGYLAVFDTASRKLVAKVPTEVTPYDVEISPDGGTVYVSNWSSDSITVVDTATNTVKQIIAVDDNPNDLLLGADGRLYVACSNSNSVVVVDTKKLAIHERIRTSMFLNAPEGSTPNALAMSRDGKTLFVANADNNNIAVVDVENPKESEVEGFVPAGWYPSALEVSRDGSLLFIANSKGQGPIRMSADHTARSPAMAQGRAR